ncbi:hypothetical protein [Geobacter sp. DSM 9736]|uniref:hypothetical protein n=1 Tax=Geobacter sp. DSM 9736 TaxID=1277350 RepID=UPI000B514883|nr:hypothetical protein [Geobacter sp. DSM 9736]SNB47895.1 hypothetical protein SAMN06269301_3389 [Geobacter sp. DSM 9736]
MGLSSPKNLATLVISLALTVISLPAVSFAGPPVIAPSSIRVLTDGVKTPLGVALDGEGNIFVADAGRRGVVRLSKFGVPTMFIKTVGVPQRVLVKDDGNILVSQGNQVIEYNNNGSEVRRLTGGDLKFANGIAVHPVTKEIHVVDSGAKLVKVFASDGSYANKSYGTNIAPPEPTRPGYVDFLMPTDIVLVDERPGGGPLRSIRFAVADTGGGRIAIFDGSGVIQSVIGRFGVNMNEFLMPQGIAVEYTDGAAADRVVERFYVVDSYHGVQVMDASWLSQGFVGRYGTGTGNLINPAAAAFDVANSRLIVSNGFGNVTMYPVDGGSNPVASDVTPPQFEILVSANNVSVPDITINGTREGADVTLRLTINTVAKVGKTEYLDAQNWRTAIAGLAPGANAITAEAVDLAGNKTTKTVTIYYTNSPFRIQSWDGLTKVNPYPFEGERPVGATVDVNLAATCSYPTVTTWRCLVTLAEGPAPTLVQFTVTDGGASSTGSASIILDTTAPDVTVYAVGDGKSTSTQVHNVIGTVADPHLDKVTVEFNGQAPQDVAVVNGVFSVPFVLNNTGSAGNIFSVKAIDRVGNERTTLPQTVNLDMNAPVVTIDAPADGITTKTSSLSLAGSVDRVATCKLGGVDANVDGLNWTISSVNLVEGYNNLVVECTAGGKTSAVKRTVYYQPAALDLTVASPKQDAATKAASVAIAGTVDSTVTSLTATLNGVSSKVNVDNGAFTFNAPLSKEGTYSVVFAAADGSGKTSISTRSVIADTTPPALATQYAYSGETPVTNASAVSGTVEPGAKVVVTNLSNQPVGTVSYTHGGFDAVLGQNYDLFSLVVAATDQAGNVTTRSAARPDGNCNGSVGGSVNSDDVLVCLDIVAGRAATNLEVAHCDIGPLQAGQINPSGQIDLADCILTLRRANTLPPEWWKKPTP